MYNELVRMRKHIGSDGTRYRLDGVYVTPNAENNTVRLFACNGCIMQEQVLAVDSLEIKGNGKTIFINDDHLKIGKYKTIKVLFDYENNLMRAFLDEKELVVPFCTKAEEPNIDHILKTLPVKEKCNIPLSFNFKLLKSLFDSLSKSMHEEIVTFSMSDNKSAIRVTFGQNDSLNVLMPIMPRDEE